MNLISDCGCLSWLGKLYRKIEDMHHEIDDIMRQNVASNVEDQVRTVSSEHNRKMFDLVLRSLPLSIDDTKQEKIYRFSRTAYEENLFENADNNDVVEIHTQTVVDQSDSKLYTPNMLSSFLNDEDFKEDSFSDSSSRGHRNSSISKRVGDKNDKISSRSSMLSSTFLHDEGIKEDFFSTCSSSPHENSLELRKQYGSLTGGLTQLYQNVNSSSTEFSQIETKNSTIKYEEDADWEII